MFRRPSGIPVPFQGVFFDDQGNVVYQAVSGTIYIERADEKSSWSGHLTIDSGEPPTVLAGQLEVNGKRECIIAFAISISYKLKFRGNGDCPVVDAAR